MYDLWFRQYVACTDASLNCMVHASALWSQSWSGWWTSPRAGADEPWLARVDRWKKGPALPAVRRCAAPVYSRYGINIAAHRAANADSLTRRGGGLR